MNKILRPMEIENKSFQIISEELGDRCFGFSENQLKIVKRVIHTTADFEYADLLSFSPLSVENALTTLKKGCCIYTDTKMILAGINKSTCSRLNIETINYISDADVKEEAKTQGCTRSAIAIRKSFKENQCQIYMIGNAPTALFELVAAYKNREIKPQLVIGVPVGFVGAKESKELLMQEDIPYIAVRGRKGGSTVAVAIINALLYILDDRR